MVFTIRMQRRRLVALTGALIGGGIFSRVDNAALPNLVLPLFTAHAESAVSFPPLAGDAWEAIPPSAVGWNEAALDDALRYANEQHSTAVMILYRGRILAERYWDGWDANRIANIFSAGKSVVAVLAGIARDAGLLEPDDPVSAHLGAGWSRASRGAEERITVRHLLTMTSGLDDALRPVADPGTVWHYNSPAYYRLQDVIASAAGVPLDMYSRNVLFSRVGMARSRWQGNGMFATAREMARFALLVQNGGMWNGTPVLRDSGYLAAATAPSQPHNPSYGYLWWLNGKEKYLLPGQGGGAGSLVPFAPPDMIAALGAGDKKMYIVPSMDLVVVRHGSAAEERGVLASSRFDNLWWRRLIAAAPKPPSANVDYSPFVP